MFETFWLIFLTLCNLWALTKVCLQRNFEENVQYQEFKLTSTNARGWGYMVCDAELGFANKILLRVCHVLKVLACYYNPLIVSIRHTLKKKKKKKRVLRECFSLVCRMFVDSLDAQIYEEHHRTSRCYLSLTKVRNSFLLLPNFRSIPLGLDLNRCVKYSHRTSIAIRGYSSFW